MTPLPRRKMGRLPKVNKPLREKTLPACPPDDDDGPFRQDYGVAMDDKPRTLKKDRISFSVAGVDGIITGNC